MLDLNKDKSHILNHIIFLWNPWCVDNLKLSEYPVLIFWNSRLIQKIFYWYSEFENLIRNPLIFWTWKFIQKSFVDILKLKTTRNPPLIFWSRRFIQISWVDILNSNLFGLSNVGNLNQLSQFISWNWPLFWRRYSESDYQVSFKENLTRNFIRHEE